MLRHTLDIRVGYKDTDCMGFVHHANYLVYYEMARTEMFRHAGLVYSELEKQGIVSPIVKAECRYLRPARYDETIHVTAEVEEISGARLTIRYEVRNDGGEVINRGLTVSAFISKATSRPVPVPKEFEKIEKA